MPLTLPPLNRRRFVRQTLAAVGGGVLWDATQTFGETHSDSENWALFSDSHVAADRELVSRDAKMAANLERCVAEALAHSPKIDAILHSGDCAYLNGLHDDYETFASLVKPVREAKLPLHMLMGNHDNRSTFAEVLGKDPSLPSPVEQRIAGLMKTPLANWFLLDSLDQTNHTPGVLGEAQRTWLTQALDAHADKPAIVVVHHNVVLTPNKNALQDSAELLQIVRPRRQVKACIFGHTHVWETPQDESGVHLINLPPTAYVFKNGLPNGWVHAVVTAHGLKLELHTLDAAHSQNHEVKDLAWRA